jgi:outer membrane lipoprotein-sorting protein
LTAIEARAARRYLPVGMSGRHRSEARLRSIGQRSGVTRRGILISVFAFGAGLFAATADAAGPPVAAPLTPQDTADLQRVAAYLNGIHTMYARFQQTSPGNATANGQLWMARPGRMRFEYDLPSPILLIADRFYVYYVDKELAITFSDLVVTRFDRGPNMLRFTVVEQNEPDVGSLTMTFSERPLALRQWSIVDQQRKTITVTLSNEQFGIALDPKLFVYQDPYAASRRQNEP